MKGEMHLKDMWIVESAKHLFTWFLLWVHPAHQGATKITCTDYTQHIAVDTIHGHNHACFIQNLQVGAELAAQNFVTIGAQLAFVISKSIGQ